MQNTTSIDMIDEEIDDDPSFRIEIRIHRSESPLLFNDLSNFSTPKSRARRVRALAEENLIRASAASSFSAYGQMMPLELLSALSQIDGNPASEKLRNFLNENGVELPKSRGTNALDIHNSAGKETVTGATVTADHGPDVLTNILAKKLAGNPFKGRVSAMPMRRVQPETSENSDRDHAPERQTDTPSG